MGGSQSRSSRHEQRPHVSLSVAIIGVGRIGSAFAYQLARAGHDVTVVARPGSRRLAQLEHDGAIVLTSGERAEVTVADHLDEQTPFDLVIVTTLAHQVGALLPTLKRSQARCVHFMFVTRKASVCDPTSRHAAPPSAWPPFWRNSTATASST